MEKEAKRVRLANLALEIIKTSAAVTQLLEEQTMAEYIQGKLTIDQVLEKLEQQATENLRRIQAARLRWARRGDPLQEH
ncbi:MAG: hypothetical protein EOO61_08060 [Hymenobacter sp.]|nr:MAG: hypothetical protein EOO61_08060 [Hymenobacter sp.]